MNRSSVLLATLTCLATLCGPAAAQTFSAGPYVGLSAGGLLLSSTDGSVGATDTKVEFKPGFDFAAQLGYRFSFLRAELEVEYGQASVDSFRAGSTKVDGDGNVGILRGTVGGYLDLTIIPIIKPYVGGGVGVASVDGETAVVDGTLVGVENSTDLTAHGELGFTWTLFPIVDLVPAYRFVWIDNGNDRIDDTTAHVFKLGTRFEF